MIMKGNERKLKPGREEGEDMQGMEESGGESLLEKLPEGRVVVMEAEMRDQNLP